jgi:hypothetical protein
MPKGSVASGISKVSLASSASSWVVQRPQRWWTNADGTLGNLALRTPLDQLSDREGMDGLTPTPHLKEMRAAHGILPHIILKVAVSLFNMARTGTNVALFADVEAGRSWPFVENRVTPGEVLSIADPLFHGVINRIEITDPDEKVVHLLRRIQEEQVFLSRYC